MNKNVKKVVIGFSGGMDSATLLGHLLSQGIEVVCCVFNYGAKHNQWENKAATNILQWYHLRGERISATYFNLAQIMTDFKSNLLSNQGEIPEGHYQEESMRLTVVPGRNLIFSAIMAGLAESCEADAVALGVHAGDHHIYPDCRTEFVKTLDATIFLSSDRRVQLLAPFDGLTKADILRVGFELNTPVPYQLTRTCYKDQFLSCGKCGSCQERLEAFQIIGKKDPIEYEEN